MSSKPARLGIWLPKKRKVNGQVRNVMVMKTRGPNGKVREQIKIRYPKRRRSPN